MLKQKKIHVVIVTGFIVLFTAISGFFIPDLLLAADCVRIRANFKKLKGVVQRKVFLEKAIIECPDDPEITYFFAYNMERRRKYDIALQYYQKVTALDENYAKAYMGIGDMYQELGQLEKAIGSYEKGLNLDPGDVWGRRSLENARRLYQRQTKLPAQVSSPQRSPPESVLSETTMRPPVKKVASEPIKDVEVAKKEETHPEKTKWEKAAVQLESSMDKDISVSTDDLIQSSVLKSTVEDEPSVITQVPSIHMIIPFAMNSRDLSDDAMSILDNTVCPALQGEEWKGKRFAVVGHTDDSGDITVNMTIARLRAHAVKAYLATRCHITPDRLEVFFEGPNQPLVPNTSLENRKKNRRVEIDSL